MMEGRAIVQLGLWPPNRIGSCHTVLIVHSNLYVYVLHMSRICIFSCFVGLIVWSVMYTIRFVYFVGSFGIVVYVSQSTSSHRDVAESLNLQ